MIINILNLSRRTTEKELAALFKVHGTVQTCDIVMDKKRRESKGFGFIKMSNDAEANIAIKHLHGMALRGKKIKVKDSGTTTMPTKSTDENI
ncbi:MAG: RNA-binding protein [Rickettsiales bacterium]|jgi:RNA recognition motif-containing protein|nr:RNA-binding protein [Rickettsiales bacterium]